MARLGLRTRVWRLLPLFILAIAGLLLALYSGGSRQVLTDLVANGRGLRELSREWGAAAALAYILSYAGLMTVLAVPAWLCSIVGGFLFGIWLGTACATAGATLGAIAVFILARRGLDGLALGAAPLVQRLEAGFTANAFGYLVLARLIPIIPFTAVNLAAAASRVALSAYVAATVLGIVPSTLIYVSLGRELAASMEVDGISQQRLLLPLFGLAGLMLSSILYRRRLGRTP